MGSKKRGRQGKRVAVPQRMQGEHDLLVRRMLGNLENVISQLKASMPPEAVRRADWSSARLRSATQVSAGLTERRGDVICDFLLDGLPAHACALVEHQSRPDPTMPYRAVGYRMGIWDEYVREHPRTPWLPPVYTFVFYTGADGAPWTAAVDIMDMHGFDVELRQASEPYVAPGRYRLVDIAGTDPKQLIASSLNSQMIITWVLTRHATKADDVLDRLEMLFEHLVAVENAAGAEQVFESIMSYVYGNWSVDEDRVEPIMVRVGTAAKEASMTTAERLRAEGRVEGRAEGERRSFLGQLEFKFGSVPADVVARVDAAGSGRLNIWSRRILTAGSIGEIFEG